MTPIPEATVEAADEAACNANESFRYTHSPPERRAIIRAALEAAREHGGGWRAIETAPRDGTVVLLAHEKAAFDGYWSEADGGWVDDVTDAYDDKLTYEPTHWQPMLALPPAPQDGSGRSNPAKQKQDDQNQQNETDAAGRPRSPSL